MQIPKVIEQHGTRSNSGSLMVVMIAFMIVNSSNGDN